MYRGYVMAYKITISCDEETHKAFQKLCLEQHVGSVSARINLFMEEEVKGREKAFLSLVERVNQLEAIVNDLPIDDNKEAGF